MKASFVLTFIFSTISFISTAIAQNNSSAKSVLDNASKVYSSYKTIMADFTLQGNNKQENSNFSEKGKVYLVPGSGKFKIEMDNHAIISDGKTQWNVLLDLGEAQITDVNPADKSINPSNIFNFYTSGYQMNKLGETKVGTNVLSIIELVPTDQSQNISKIQLRINNSSGFIYDASVFDKNGNKYTYTLTNIEVNKTFSSGIFSFYKHNYPDIEIVDLR
ncbi:LolA family protein [Albibacterium bauzanense]|uniref:Outer membrane lipoprotein-sorting protein n=1 Tax=Albibacterium bauzanense TaxID=653929 RepID=A0A4R1M0R5_9SPHI|nr:outer membrane lipoprotein carrier protein LolA [Albibacterium bauzanense]TCK84802.1 outer membrane lipoprotein-sorting protein [Albibacterium bauzanense]